MLLCKAHRELVYTYYALYKSQLLLLLYYSMTITIEIRSLSNFAGLLLRISGECGGTNLPYGVFVEVR